MSEVSFMTEVEMATEEVFSGPLAESVPTSVSAFSHRPGARFRSDSTPSFQFFDEEQDGLEWSEESAIVDEDAESLNGDLQYEHYDSDNLESGRRPAGNRRKSSGYSRHSAQADEPLLLRRTSSSSSTRSGRHANGRHNQKIYILTEDLTIVVAGFTTSWIGFSIYIIFCVMTGGLGYLLLRWLPRWRIGLVGKSAPLREAAWVVIENQWGEVATQDIVQVPYGRSLSSVFGTHEKAILRDYHEDDDPGRCNLK